MYCTLAGNPILFRIDRGQTLNSGNRFSPSVSMQPVVSYDSSDRIQAYLFISLALNHRPQTAKHTYFYNLNPI